MPGLEHTHTLLATLGGQPQVVTFTLDLLLQRHIPIREVIVVHPASQPKLQHSIACLNAEFPGDRYKVDGRTIHFRRHVLRDYDRPIDDIVDERTADGALNTMDELIRRPPLAPLHARSCRAPSQRWRNHACPTRGRCTAHRGPLRAPGSTYSLSCAQFWPSRYENGYSLSR